MLIYIFVTDLALKANNTLSVFPIKYSKFQETMNKDLSISQNYRAVIFSFSNGSAPFHLPPPAKTV